MSYGNIHHTLVEIGVNSCRRKHQCSEGKTGQDSNHALRERRGETATTKKVERTPAAKDSLESSEKVIGLVHVHDRQVGHSSPKL